MLLVGWKATRLEVIQVIRYTDAILSDLTVRDVCDKLLDKAVPEKKRYIRAEAILMIGRIFRATQRDPSQADSEDYQFEHLLASSQKKKKKGSKVAQQDRTHVGAFPNGKS